jgi:hypothetical protein
MTINNNIYELVCATPLSREEFNQKSQLSLFLDKFGWNSGINIIYENKQGLPKIYNSFLNDQNRNKKIIFIHDDVLVEDIFLLEKLEIGFEKYNIIGLAGTKKCNLNSNISAWHMMCERQDMIGEVGHSKDKVSWTTVFGSTDSRALLLDGLFIAVDVNSLLDTNTRFDENFDFHHYDITFCINANKNKLKLGVCPIKVTHFGLGDSMISKEWEHSNLKFKQLYKNG